METNAIEMLGITKTFPGIVANDNVSITVKNNEVLALLGENGAGKSTLMSILWIVLPYSNPVMVWAYSSSGLRTTITLEGYWLNILNNFGAIRYGSFRFPTGIILFAVICMLLMKLFMKTRTGTALTAVGSNPDFARASGVSINRARTISIILSTVCGGIGILLYQQSFGFIQLYKAPLYGAFLYFLFKHHSLSDTDTFKTNINRFF